uniref:DUF7808 domain-containing protein n=2 Tax=Caenorhabditis japonica TaxID=281687 RepID=A0A8R1HV09_CAEJA
MTTMKTLLILTIIGCVATQETDHQPSWPRFQIIGNRLETTEKWHRFGVLAETREYACARKSSRSTKSDCELRFGGELSAINDNGCFMHFDAKRQESVELCPLQCQQFTEAVILKTSDSLICSPGVAVGVERRQSDWFMWRSGACRGSDVIFQLECSMSKPMVEEEVEEKAEPKEEMVINDNAIGDSETEGMWSSIEDITSQRQDTTTVTSSSSSTTATKKPETLEATDDLPEKVDTILGFMFPSYRKKALSQ